MLSFTGLSQAVRGGCANVGCESIHLAPCPLARSGRALGTSSSIQRRSTKNKSRGYSPEHRFSPADRRHSPTRRGAVDPPRCRVHRHPLGHARQQGCTSCPFARRCVAAPRPFHIGPLVRAFMSLCCADSCVSAVQPCAHSRRRSPTFRDHARSATVRSRGRLQRSSTSARGRRSLRPRHGRGFRPTNGTLRLPARAAQRWSTARGRFGRSAPFLPMWSISATRPESEPSAKRNRPCGSPAPVAPRRWCPWRHHRHR